MGRSSKKAKAALGARERLRPDSVLRRLPAGGIPPDQQTAFAQPLDPCWTLRPRLSHAWAPSIVSMFGARDTQQVLYAALATLASIFHRSRSRGWMGEITRDRKPSRTVSIPGRVRILCLFPIVARDLGQGFERVEALSDKSPTYPTINIFAAGWPHAFEAILSATASFFGCGSSFIVKMKAESRKQIPLAAISGHWASAMP